MHLSASSFFHILNFSADVSIQMSTSYIMYVKTLLFCPSLFFSPPAPPSAPVSLTWEYESGNGGVSLRWRPPADMGGRSEVWYGVVCRICPSPTFTNPASCSWCGEGVTFSPSQTNLKQTKVTLNNLLTRVTYLIQVLWKTICCRRFSSLINLLLLYRSPWTLEVILKINSVNKHFSEPQRKQVPYGACMLYYCISSFI